MMRHRSVAVGRWSESDVAKTICGPRLPTSEHDASRNNFASVLSALLLALAGVSAYSKLNRGEFYGAASEYCFASAS